MSRTPNNTSPLVNNIQGKAYFLNQKLLLKYFLQDTADVYYGFLEINSTVNFVSEKWQHYFGFLPSPEQDILKERAKFLLDNSPKEYALLFKSLKTNEQVTFTYNYRNTIDKTIFRFSECVTKLYDEQLDEYIIAGRISEIKNNFSDSHFEQRVNEEKEKLNRLVNETKDIVLVTNTKGKIELMSSTVK